MSVSLDAPAKVQQVTLTSGEPMTITLYGQQHRLTMVAPLCVPIFAAVQSGEVAGA